MAAAAPADAATAVTLLGGQPLPALGFGTWRCDVDKLDAAVYHAVRVGYRHMDCAGLYKNEHIVGAALARAMADGLATRGELFITSKLAPSQMTPGAVRPAIDKTLKDLGVAYLDLFITHWPYGVGPACTASPPPWEQRRGYDPAAYLAVWREMEAAVDAGLVRALGCSNMTAKKLHALRQAARIPPSVIQVEMHPCLAQPALLAYCRRHAIAVTAYCPLGSPGRPAQYRAAGDPEVLTHPALLAVAGRLGKTPAQVALRWALQRGTVPLPRSTTLARIEENYGVWGWAIPAEDMAALASMDASAGSVGRIMKGDNFQLEGRDWREVWDEGWTEEGEGEGEGPAA
jgi:alcohol dehydrogenase (NADP+)